METCGGFIKSDMLPEINIVQEGTLKMRLFGENLARKLWLYLSQMPPPAKEEEVVSIQKE